MNAPNVHRPFKIPFGTIGCVVILTCPVVFMFVMLAMATLKTWIVCGLLGAGGYVLFAFLDIARRRKWIEFESRIREDELDGRKSSENNGVDDDDVRLLQQTQK